MDTPPNSSSQRPYRWPWFVLAALFLGVALAVLWMSVEVRRTKERRAYIIPKTDTNATPAPPR